MAQTTVPEAYICPITLAIMTDPVVCGTGITYERAAIVEWMRNHHNSCPITGKPISMDTVQPNVLLRQIIQDWHVLNTDTDAPAAAMSVEDTHTLRASNPSFTHCVGNDSKFLSFDIEAPLTVKLPRTIIFVIDTSGSMHIVDEVPGASSSEIGFSRLSLVLHSVSTCVDLLSPDDYVALIGFSNITTVYMHATKMDDAGKAQLAAALLRCAPSGSTDTMSGLQCALVMASTLGARNIGPVDIVLMSDGLPDSEPTSLFLQTTISKYSPIWPSTINTVAYGPNSASPLLYRIAKYGRGSFSFISDMSTFASTLVNICATLLLRTIPWVSVEVTSNLPSASKYLIGSICNSNPRRVSVVLPNKTESISRVQLTYPALTSSVVHEVELPGVPATATFVTEADKSSSLALFVDVLSEWTQAGPGIVRGRQLSYDPSSGQVALATLPQYLNTWGLNYIRSLVSAHMRAESTNFIEKSTDIYKWPAFEEAVARAEGVFFETPIRRVYLPGEAAPAGSKGTVCLNAATYYNTSGGCFSARTRLTATDKDGRKTRPVAAMDVVRGMYLFTSLGAARVDAVVATKTYHTSAHGGPFFVQLADDVEATLWHPVKRVSDNKWIFPHDLVREKRLAVCETEYMYTFLLEEPFYDVLLGEECEYAGITLAHGIWDGSIAEHAYFGSKFVRHDVRLLAGDDKDGVARLDPAKFTRSDTNGRVLSFINSLVPAV